MDPSQKRTTSWEGSSSWYSEIVGEKGHYYHEQVIFPKLLKLLELKNKSRLLDLAAGSGPLAKLLSKEADYLGIDLSPSLIKEAKRLNPGREFLIGDITEPLPTDRTFTHAALILALQNIEHPDKALQNAAKHLEKGGRLALVLNHPCFRIPRQSSWGIDAPKRLQYRRIDSYMSSMTIPIQSAPSKGEKSESTISFHHSLSEYSKWLKSAGFVIELIDEWVSDKTSTGGAARMENRARKEIPLFLALLAIKN